MLLNRFEKLLVKNPVRAALQRGIETRWLLEMGGPMEGGRALEVGCGSGVGTGIILDQFKADHVDAFDLDPAMVASARRRLSKRGEKVHLWNGDATAITSDDATYDAVFDFAIIHHVPDWPSALREVHRVLKPGGRFYVEEVLRNFILNPVWRRLLDHPLENRFDHDGFRDALAENGFELMGSRQLWGWFAWFVARRNAN